MNRQMFLRRAGLAVGGLLFGSALSGCGGGDEEALASSSASAGAPAILPTPDVVADLSPEEVAGLLFMREEEKLAQDVYLALYARWGTQVFASIAESEAEHTEAIRRLIEAHGLVDPAATNPTGVFENDDLQALYDRLVAMGQPSLIDALKVGCLIEEKDIQDINDKKAEVLDEPDIVQVYDHLLCGSRNHLRAFNRTLFNQGGVYLPEVITQAEWDAIANSPSETCGG